MRTIIAVMESMNNSLQIVQCSTINISFLGGNSDIFDIFVKIVQIFMTQRRINVLQCSSDITRHYIVT